jgi:hypothetical protein
MNKKHILLSIGMLCLLVLAVHAPDVFAQSALQNPLGTSDLRVVIGNIIKAALGLTGVLALLMFIWGGIQWLTSGGSPEKVKAGKSTLTWAVIGLVVIFTSYTLVSTLITALSSGTVE